MSAQEILDELPKLSPAEIQLVAERARELSPPAEAELRNVDGHTRTFFHRLITQEEVDQALAVFP